jgi:hypothetical protein
MSDTHSRRKLLKAGAVAAAAAAVPLAMAREVTVEELEKGLGKPLTPDNRKLAQGALQRVRGESAARMRHRLQENSEPSFVYSVRPGATKEW